MPDGATRGSDATVTAGAVALGFLLLEMLRTWLPSLVVVLGEGRGVGPVGLAGVALGTLSLAPLAGSAFGPLPPRIAWILGGATLLGARLTLGFVSGGDAQLTVTTVGVAGGALAVAALAGGSTRGDTARLGLLAGSAASFAVLAVLGSVDLVWRGGLFGAAATLAVLVITAPAIAGATRALEGGRAAAAWPWGALGPALVLQAVLVGPAGRVAVATGWEPGPVAATVVGLQALAVISAVIGARLGPLAAGTAGAALVLIGTAASLGADSPSSVAGQAALAAGLGFALVSGLRGGSTTGRRRGVVAGLSLVLFGTLIFAAYANALVRLPFGLHGVMLVSAALLATSSLLGTVRAARLGREAPSPVLGRALAVTTVLALVLAGVGSLRGASEIDERDDDGTLRIALANVHYGYDIDGRQRALEVGDLLADLEADLIALNEVDRGWLISGAPDLLSTYAVATGMEPVFAPASDEIWGNALLTRLPVLEVQRNRLPRGRDPLVRSALTVVVELPDGSPLGVVVTHLSNVDRQGDTRLPQAQAVAAIVARLQERGIPTVVAGDLNARPEDPELGVLEDLGLTRTLPASRPTFPDVAARVQIDHVLIPPGLVVEQARTLTTGLSDHRFVSVVLRREGPDDADGPGGPDSP